MNDNSFTLDDLILAYKKAKVDIFYSSHASLFDLRDYELNLLSNLARLLTLINGDDESWVGDGTFLGDVFYAGTGLGFRSEHTIVDSKDFRRDDEPLWSDPWQNWKRDLRRNPVVSFRLMAAPSIDFAVLSTVWLNCAGALFDSLLTDRSRGSRLRLTRDGNVNPRSLGSYKPYLRHYKAWRDDGMTAMRKSLQDEKGLVAISTDITSFYHSIDPSFLTTKDFLNDLNVTLTAKQQRISRLFEKALVAWTKTTPLPRGLPVGLPASATVANVLLHHLDRTIEQQIAPIYYGRYVDDLLIVLENNGNFVEQRGVWEWIAARFFDNSLAIVNDADSFKAVYRPPFSSTSILEFSGKKTKVHFVQGPTGETLLEAIRDVIRERSSEWRALPEIPEDSTEFSSKLVSAIQADGEASMLLGKTMALSLRRSKFAIDLRNLESISRDLQPERWKKQRVQFLETVANHVLVPPVFFELETYIPRIVSLAVSNGDFGALSTIVTRIGKVVADVERIECEVKIKSADDDVLQDKALIVAAWRDRLFFRIKQAITTSFPNELKSDELREWEVFRVKHYEVLGDLIDLRKIKRLSRDMFSRDLGNVPFRKRFLPEEVAGKGVDRSSNFPVVDGTVVPDTAKEGLSRLFRWLRIKKGMPLAFEFSTRPFNLMELCVLGRPIGDRNYGNVLSSILTALRGYEAETRFIDSGSDGTVVVPFSNLKTKFQIAVASWMTTTESWKSAVVGSHDTSLDRLNRLSHLINHLVKRPFDTSYLVFPELSLPAKWFLSLGYHLLRSEVSLIGGVEYIQSSRKSEVHNQVWMSLISSCKGIVHPVIVCQDKQSPPLDEEDGLRKIGGKRLVPKNEWILERPPLIKHGIHHFAVLVCSELTNIKYRSSLTGRIDSLFVPEWNRDLNSFNALVESAAMDIHAYIVQCNNRLFGDSRIRAPYAEDWKRDIMRIRGGVADYFVIGQIDILALRKFQSYARSPKEPFKPVPDGFSIDPTRKTIP